jgi:hypothetical protein
MKYNRTIKYKIKARLNANNYKLEYTVKSSLLKEFERLTQLKLNNSYGVSYNAYTQELSKRSNRSRKCRQSARFL